MISARSASEGLARRDDQQPLLLQGASTGSSDVVVGVAELAHAAGRADVAHQVGEHPRQRVLVGVRDRLAGDQLGGARCFSGSASYVKRNAAGAVTITDQPCGTNGWSSG